MEPAQPADRVPADQTAPELPPVEPAPPGPAPPVTAEEPAAPVTAEEPALVEPATGPATASGPTETTGVGETSGAGETSAAREAGESSAPPAAADTTRSERSPKDMAISLLVLLVPIALLLAFYRGFLGGDQATVVDPAPALDSAQAAAAFPVSQPQGLDAGWRTVRADFRTVEDGSTLRLGYLTPEGRGAQIVQSSVPPEQLLPTELTDQGQPQGRTDLAGRTWQRYTARGNEQAFVLLEPDRTVIVVGDARDTELRELAGALG
ncbi:DUF4245 domain-containing protein [Salinispora sp. H7-4]|uniref:DUF4245 domain-containing protein n=1 Tax=Salinispora sp. H7-4 TaxID=2748321 RepID=UPI0015D25314|nr:DUF4245 family protein [Salinispora sp. H7-4]NYT94207.1 DUF4245 family protein [Salinispora sp. H7-4]